MYMYMLYTVHAHYMYMLYTVHAHYTYMCTCTCTYQTVGFFKFLYTCMHTHNQQGQP